MLWTPIRSEGYLPAFQGSGNNFLSSSLASNDVNRARGFDQDQISTTGNVDIALAGSALLQVRGGYFYDGFKDTGVPNNVSHTYQATTTGVPGIPASLQGPIGTQDIQRILLNVSDKTTRSFVNVDFNQPFNAGGQHTLKAGVGFQRTVNDVNKAYKRRRVCVPLVGPEFRVPGRSRQRDLRVLRGEQLRHAGQSGRRHYLVVRAGPVVGWPAADAEPRRPDRAGNYSVVPASDPGERDRVRIRRQDRTTARRQL